MTKWVRSFGLIASVPGFAGLNVRSAIGVTLV